jgi:hypothetical protein
MSEQDTAVEIVFDQPEPEQAKPEQASTPEKVEEAAKAEPDTASDEKEQVAPKTYSEEELKKHIDDEAAKIRNKYERKMERQRIEVETRAKLAQEQASQAAPTSEIPKPKETDYETYGEYLEALAEHKAVEILRREREAAQQAKIRESQVSESERYAKLEQAVIENGEAKYDDFEEVARGTGEMLKSKGLAFSKAMVSALIEAENAPDIVYHLGKNLDEAARIAALPAYAQAKEIGKLEDKLSAKPAPKPSKAPDPISPVTGSKALTKSIEDMSVQEFEEYGRKRGAIWAR